METATMETATMEATAMEATTMEATPAPLRVAFRRGDKNGQHNREDDRELSCHCASLPSPDTS